MPRKPLVRGNLPTYAVNIRRLLRERELTHKKFAELTGINIQSMYAALNGGDIRMTTFLKMARALKVDPHVLLMAEPPESIPSLEHVKTTDDLKGAIAVLLAELARTR